MAEQSERGSAWERFVTGCAASLVGVVCMAIAVLPVRIEAADLRAVAEQSTVRLTTLGRRTGKPHTVTIWFVYDDGVIYVQSGRGGKTDWYRNLRKNPAVTLQFKGVRVRGRAELVADTALVARVHARFRDKYWLARASGWIGRDIGRGKVVRVRIDS